MINFVRAIVLGMCLTGLSVSSAKATTYEYVGNPLDVVYPYFLAGGGGTFTGSVTFDFNTFGFTGTIFLNSGHVTALPFGEGLNAYFQYGHFVLEKGAVTDWNLQSPYGAGMSSFGTFGDYVEYGGPCFPICYIAFNRSPGVWTPIDIAPAPAPIIGAGLPGLVIAVAGFIGWRRSRRTGHSTAA